MKALQLSVLAFAILFLLIFIVLQLPTVKLALAKKVVAFVEERTSHRVDLEGVTVSWLDHFVLENVSLRDLEDSVMLEAGQVRVDFTLTTLINRDVLRLDDIYLSDSRINLVRYPEAPSLNLKIFLDSLSNQPVKGERRKLAISVGNIETDRMRFHHTNLNKQQKPDFIDPNYLSLYINHGLFSDLKLWSDTLDLDVLQLQLEERERGMVVNSFNSKLHLDPHHIVLDDFALETPSSQVGDSLSLTFNHLGNLGYFMDSVVLHARLDEALLSTRDLRYFGKVGVDTTFQLSGGFSGTVSNLSVDNLSISTETGSFVICSGTLIGLPRLRNTFLDIDVEDGILRTGDIRKTIGKYSFGDDIRVQGNFSGFVTDFVAYGLFQTAHGTVRSNLNFKIPTTMAEAKYKGDFQLQDFDLSRVFRDTIVGTVDMHATVVGEGLTRENADFFLDAELQNLLFNRYRLDSMDVRGSFRENFYDGTVEVNDPNCRISGSTRIDLTGSTESLALDLDIWTLHLEPLNWSSSKFDIQSKLAVQLEDLELDRATGSLNFENTYLEKASGSYYINDFLLSSSRAKGRRVYTLHSPMLEGQLAGKFLPSEVLDDFPVIARDFYTLLTEERDSIDSKISHAMNQDNYQWELTLDIIELNTLFEFLQMPIAISRNSHFEAAFRRSKNINLDVLFESDSITYQNATVFDNLLEFNVSRDTSSSDVLAIIQLASRRQRWQRFAETQNFFLESVWFNNEIDSRIELEQDAFHSNLRLNARTLYLKDSILLSFGPSRILVVDQDWQFNQDNRLIWSDRELSLQELEVSTGDQSFQLEGHYRPRGETDIKLDVSQLNVSTLNPFIRNRSIAGRMDFRGSLRSDSLANVVLQGYLMTDSLTLDDFEIGNIEGSTLWDSEQKLGKFNLNLQRQGVRTIFLEGQIAPEEPYDQLEVDIQFDEARVSLIEPFVGRVFQNIKGQVSGAITVGGPFEAPIFSGSSKVKNGELTFGYTNTTYLFSGDVNFDSYEISFQGLDVMDRSNGTGKLFGSIYHENLQNLQVNFYLDFTRMQLLNTVAIDNDLYYGRAYGSGNLNLSGPLKRLNLAAEITSDPGTRIFFPLGSETEVSRSEFISFVDHTNPYQEQERPSNIRLDSEGMSLDLDLNVTSDAYAELIFDAQTGDIIRGRTDGNLQFRMNPAGEITLLGGLEIESGAYNFTVPGINKEFELRNGGTINWTGDPYEGTIDLEATYRQIADLSDWDDQISSSQKIPFLVVLDLEGPMMQPDIGFGIEVADDAAISLNSQDLQQFLITTNEREDELNRQVFSLLMLRKLSPRNSFEVGTVGQGLSGSVSEILSNQLSYWLSQSNENLEVDIDLTALNQEAFNTFQYRLAYSFLDGRLKVSGGNSLNSNNSTFVSENLRQNNNAIIGNWSVEYLLTEDGRWRAKVFSRANQSLAANAGVNNNQQTGISLQFIRSFDEFRNLISKIRTDDQAELGNQNTPDSGNSISPQSKAN